MDRRRFLATASPLAGVALAGCLSSDPASTEPTETTPTVTPASDPSETATPEWVSESCEAPAVDGLPEPPETRTRDRVVDYVTEFERTYVVATREGYDDIEDISVTTTEETDDGYRVELAVEGSTETPGADETPQPADATSHRATYRLSKNHLLREHQGYAAGRTLSDDCWRVGTD